MKKKTKNSAGKSKRELFCRFYAGPCWGDPAGAAGKAGYENPEEKAAELLSEPEIVEKIQDLRKKKSALSLADEAWIREAFIGIFNSAEKDSDRIRALAGLHKILADSHKNTREEKDPKNEFLQEELPLFEGCPDGDGMI